MRTFLAAAAACLSVVGLSHAGDADASVKTSVSIPAQDLSSALRSFAEGRQLYIIYAHKDVDARHTKGVSGELTQDEALRELLDGTGLMFRYLDEKTISVLPLATSPPRADADEPRHITLAQAPASKVAEAPSEGGQLGEIVVTAQRREERLQDVPISAAAFSQQDLEGRGVVGTADLLSSVVNVNVTSGTGSNQDATVSIRGVGTLPFLEADQGIGVYVDDVFIGTIGAIDFDLGDLERIEVLRGPQGTLYGRNALGGAINIVSMAPQREPEFGLVGEIGDERTHRARLTANVPLSDRLSLRGTFGWRETDGWVRNAFSGTDSVDGESLPTDIRSLPATETKSARVGLRFLPTESWAATLSADYLEDSGASAPFGDVATLLEDAEVAIAVPSRAERKIRGASAKLEHDGSFTFQSITGYRKVERDISGGLFEPTDLIRQGIVRDQDQLSQELRFLSSSQERLSWIFGLFYFESSEFTDTFYGFTEDFGGFFPAGYAEGSLADVDTQGYAAYAEGTYALTDRLKATLGLRYSRDEKSLTYTHDNNLGLPFTAFATRALDHRDSQRFSDVSPKLTLMRSLTEEVNLYGSASKGYKAGGFQIQFAGSPSSPSLPDLGYEKETAWSYELGLKSRLLDGRASLNLAAYYFDWKNQQVNVFETDPTGLTGFLRVANAPRSRSVGGELEFAVRPIRPLQLHAALGYMDSEFTEYPNPATGVASAAGNKQPYVPSFTADVGAEWSVSRASGRWIARFDVNHRNGFYDDVLNSNRLDGYTLLNGRFGLQSPDERWSVFVVGKNLTDEHYLTNASPPSFLAGYPLEGILGATRYWGVELQWWLRGAE